METSMRYRSDEAHLYLHAKENFVSDGNFVLQVHGRLNTTTGQPSATVQLKKKMFPQMLTNVDIGAKVNLGIERAPEVLYAATGKKTIEITDSGLLALDLKAGYQYNANEQKATPKAVIELSQKVFNFTDDQDLKLKLGYDLIQNKPFCQVRENNWTLNVNLRQGTTRNLHWNVAYDL